MLWRFCYHKLSLLSVVMITAFSYFFGLESSVPFWSLQILVLETETITLGISPTFPFLPQSRPPFHPSLFSFPSSLPLSYSSRRPPVLFHLVKRSGLTDSLQLCKSSWRAFAWEALVKSIAFAITCFQINHIRAAHVTKPAISLPHRIFKLAPILGYFQLSLKIIGKPSIETVVM